MLKLYSAMLVNCVWALSLAAQSSAPQTQLIEDAGFTPSGWMGDGAVKADKPEGAPLRVNTLSIVNPHSPPYSQEWNYRPRLGKVGWAAVAWQFPEDNWGDKPGKDWSKRGFGAVTVWARGVRDRSGRLPKVQFKAGGGGDPTKKYQASFEVEGDFVTLTEDWKRYSLDLNGQNLSQVIAAFVVVIRSQDVGGDGGTFFLDDVEYQPKRGAAAGLGGPKTNAELARLTEGTWVAYAPTNFNPEANPPLLPSDESLRADLKVLRDAGFDGLVTYSADFPAIPRIAEELGFRSVLLGVWAPGDAEELQRAEEAARRPIVAGIIVGNEGLMERRYDLMTLQRAMERARHDTGKPVSTTEVIESYFTKPELAEWSDFLAVNAHPFFHEVHRPKDAADWTLKAYRNLSQRYPDKVVLFKEVGLPTAAEGLGEQAQFDYYRALLDTEVRFAFFEAFDALFKSGPIEQSWGIFHADRTAKPAAALARYRSPAHRLGGSGSPE